MLQLNLYQKIHHKAFKPFGSGGKFLLTQKAGQVPRSLPQGRLQRLACRSLLLPSVDKVSRRRA